MNLRRYLIILMLVFLVASVAVQAEDALIGKPAPEIAAMAWLNSAPLTLTTLKGRPVVVEFWATWCPPCRRSVPHLNEVYRKFSPRGVAFVSLTDETYDTVKNFAEELKISYPVGTGSPTADAYGVKGIPHAVVISADGKILWTGHPMDQIEKRIEDALAAMTEEARKAIAAPAEPNEEKAPAPTTEGTVKP